MELIKHLSNSFRHGAATISCDIYKYDECGYLAKIDVPGLPVITVNADKLDELAKEVVHVLDNLQNCLEAASEIVWDWHLYGDDSLYAN